MTESIKIPTMLGVKVTPDFEVTARKFYQYCRDTTRKPGPVMKKLIEMLVIVRETPDEKREKVLKKLIKDLYYA
jgi:hypothetical protein